MKVQAVISLKAKHPLGLLLKAGRRIAKKTVLKLMRQTGLLSHVRRRRRYDSFKGEAGQVAPNLLDRDFDAGEPTRSGSPT